MELDPLTYTTSTIIVGVITVALIFLARRWNRQSRLPKGVRYPPHLWSPLPFIGSALDMTAGLTRNFIAKYGKKFNSPVFTAIIAGQKCAFISDPGLVYIVFRDSIHQIDSLSLQKKAMIDLFGIDRREVEKILQVGDLVKKANAQIRQFLVNDAPLNKSIRESQELLHQNLQELITSISGVENNEWTTHAMHDLVKRAIFSASVGPLVSKGLMTEEIMNNYFIFDEGLPLLFGDAPSFMTRSARSARLEIVKSLSTSEVQGQFSEFMVARKELHEPNFSKEVFARFNLGLLVASISNSIPAVFWTLYNLLEHPSAFAACRDAVDKVASRKEKGRNYFTLEELDDLMILQSCFLETLRLYQIFFVVRDVTEDFVINPKETMGPKYMIEKGTRIMAFPNTVHMDPQLFVEPDVFQYDRFIDPKENGALLCNPELRLFGGGAHLCPGRKFIGYETRAFLAMMILELDMRLPEGGTKPKIDLTRQGSSVAHPTRDPDFQIRTRTG